MLFLLATAALSTSPFLCEPAFTKEFCPDALGAGPEKCLTCAFEHYLQLQDGYACTQGIIQSACGATEEEWNAVVAPYVASSNWACGDYNGACSSCVAATSYWVSQCYYCYQDKKCYGIGGAGGEACNNAIGDYGCVSASSFSSCQCPTSALGDDDGAGYSCYEEQCPVPQTYQGAMCQMCEYAVQTQMGAAGYFCDAAGAAAQDGLCNYCCSKVAVVGPMACNAVLSALGSCSAIIDAIVNHGSSACTACAYLGACASCGPSTSAKTLPWKVGNNTAVPHST
jgi:hypothetical protein